MRGKIWLAAALVALSAAVALGLEPSVENPSTLVGSYRLVTRDLPDGTSMTPPDIQGMLTYTDRYRNFNIFVRNADGRSFSISSIAEYELTDDTYSETSLYYMVNDEIGGAGISYDVSPQTGTTPVIREEDRISMTLPLHGEPAVVIDGGGLTATREGQFVDHWERVE
ncbi:MAG TPA: hypothetical protein VM737_05560 [Gemmatimonadota bacterium]|nr:hypothetical protein [Gemmatimonadota bacterium]